MVNCYRCKVQPRADGSLNCKDCNKFFRRCVEQATRVYQGKKPGRRNRGPIIPKSESSDGRNRGRKAERDK